MNLVSDIITYIRRIIKSPSNASISNDLLIDYINRFWIMDVDARIQLFDLKTKYSFQTTPGVDRYNMPMYDVQTELGDNFTQSINMYPVYQGFLGPAYINGVQVAFQTQKQHFYSSFPNIVQNSIVLATGNGTAGPYTLTFPIGPNNNPPNPPYNTPINAIVRGHVDMYGIVATGLNVDPVFGTTLNLNIPSTSIEPAVYFTATGNDGSNIIVQDSGQFLTGNQNYGLLMVPGKAPFGYSASPNGYQVSFVITGATQSSSVVLTAVTSFEEGQIVLISGVSGMTELNGNTYTVTSVTPTTVTLNVDSTGFTAYTSGGTVSSLQNVINYFTGVATNVYFPAAIPNGAHINGQCNYFQTGIPRSILFYNNTITLRVPPSRQYLVEMDAYLSPTSYLNTTSGLKFAYMAEYIARGAARKILSDTGDIEQLQFYEPLFREQEMLVWKRSQRQWTSTRTETIYSQGMRSGQSGFSGFGGGNTI